MSDDSLVCPVCSYENVVLTCGFCLQCGAEFDESEVPSGPSHIEEAPPSRSVPVFANESAVAVETEPFTVAAALATLRRLERDRAWQFTEVVNGWQVVTPVEDDRKQRLHVTCEPDKHNQLKLRITSLAGPYRQELALPLLQSNIRAELAAVAVREINGKTYLVVTFGSPLDLLSSELFCAAMWNVAKLADRIEHKLNRGRDRL
ncbi:MAG: hypothetical protein KDA60_01210 [Planctomycetales bacterium]|nr:hypothetical protein [Planctomycetales bacterium]